MQWELRVRPTDPKEGYHSSDSILEWYTGPESVFVTQLDDSTLHPVLKTAMVVGVENNNVTPVSSMAQLSTWVIRSRGEAACKTRPQSVFVGSFREGLR